MKIKLFIAAGLLTLAACQAPAPQSAAADGAHSPAQPSFDSTRQLRQSAPLRGGSAASETQAKAAVARYVATLPSPQRYVTDSARATDTGTSWQVLVPRTDWAKRMPSRAAFEVDKATGSVSARPVK